MNDILSKSAEIVQNALSAKGVGFKVVELSESTRTAADAASAIRCTVEQIVKSLIFKTQETNKPVLVLVSGPNRVNEKLVEAELGEAIIKAEPDFAREVTGFAIGGIPPVGHKQQITTLIDEDLLKYEELWAAAGTPNAVFSFESKRLESLTDGKVIAIK